jgi:hypothetical protein
MSARCAWCAASRAAWEKMTTRRYLQHAANGDVIVQPVRYFTSRRLLAGVFAFDRNAHAVARWRIGHAVLAQLGVAVGESDGHADILAGLERGHWRAVVGDEADRFNVGRLLRYLGYPHRAGLARLDAGVRIHRFLGVDEQSGERGVRFVPGGQQRRGGGVAQRFGNRAEQVLADDRIVFGADTDRDVLVDDAVDHRAERAWVADVGGVREDGGGERLLLRAVGLVAHVEQVAQFRMGGKNVAVERGGDGKAMFAQDGNAGIDVGAGSG